VFYVKQASRNAIQGNTTTTFETKIKHNLQICYLLSRHLILSSNLNTITWNSCKFTQF